MATSPRDELRIVAITEFYRDDGNEWRWRTIASNGRRVGTSGEGYHNLQDAVHGFFVQQGVDEVAIQSEPAERQHYSKLYAIGPGVYHIRRYAHGAPEPWGTD